MRTPPDWGAHVICLDNFFTGTHRNIDSLLDYKHFELIRHDVTFPFYGELDFVRLCSLRKRVFHSVPDLDGN
jgi:hypothetical protein